MKFNKYYFTLLNDKQREDIKNFRNQELVGDPKFYYGTPEDQKLKETMADMYVDVVENGWLPPNMREKDNRAASPKDNRAASPPQTTC